VNFDDEEEQALELISEIFEHFNAAIQPELD
jgi:hypothetical protein